MSEKERDPEAWEILPVPRASTSPTAKIVNRVRVAVRAVYWRSRLAGFGSRSDLVAPIQVTGGRGIVIGDGVRVWRGGRIEALDVSQGPILRVGNGTQIHPEVHIGAIRSVTIGAGVLMASRVYISDHDHDHSDPDEPVVSNRRLRYAPVRIGDYVWLGEGVMVLKGVTIGDRSVIGAGSVVTRNIPALSLAVGSPARVVQRYDERTRSWTKV